MHLVFTSENVGQDFGHVTYKKTLQMRLETEVQFANANGLTFFNPRAQGLLRTLMLRTSSTGDHGFDPVF
jgi:hypothetical protein